MVLGPSNIADTTGFNYNIIRVLCDSYHKTTTSPIVCPCFSDFKECSVTDFVLKRKARNSNSNVALIDGITNREIGFDQLEEETYNVSNNLKAFGLQHGDVACLYGTNTPEFAHVFLGVTAVGAALTIANSQLTSGYNVSWTSGLFEKKMAMFSRVLYRALDHLGYNDDIVKFRREFWKIHTEVFFKFDINGPSASIVAGSKGEGITSMFESDIDLISLLNNVLRVFTADQLPNRLPRHTDAVGLADMENVPPGYTRLKLYRSESFRNVIDQDLRSCLFQSESGDIYLSSTFWAAVTKKALNGNNFGIIHEVTGPAAPWSGGGFSIDHVLGFTFHCPQLLQTWASRPRQHEWPSRGTVRTACSFLPQVVAVGAKGSDRQYQEWRFCFIESELTLTHSFNGTQIKLYILLKTIAKNILKQVMGEISSYIMKNITYWLSELLPLHVFREENLVSLVLLALTFLRTAITKWHTLPYYMIPTRNLLSERLDDRTQRELSDVLYRLVDEGPRLFLRIEKIRKCLEIASRSPKDIVMRGKVRDRLEKYELFRHLLAAFKDNGLHIDESKEASINMAIISLVRLYSRLVDPSRHGRVDVH